MMSHEACGMPTWVMAPHGRDPALVESQDGASYHYGCLATFWVRFSMATTIPGVLVVSLKLTTRSERSIPSCEQLHSHLAATAAEGSKEWFHDHTPVVRPTDELQTTTHIA